MRRSGSTPEVGERLVCTMIYSKYSKKSSAGQQQKRSRGFRVWGLGCQARTHAGLGGVSPTLFTRLCFGIGVRVKPL